MLVFDVSKMKTAVLRIRLLQSATCYNAGTVSSMESLVSADGRSLG